MAASNDTKLLMGHQSGALNLTNVSRIVYAHEGFNDYVLPISGQEPRGRAQEVCA